METFIFSQRYLSGNDILFQWLILLYERIKELKEERGGEDGEMKIDWQQFLC